MKPSVVPLWWIYLVLTALALIPAVVFIASDPSPWRFVGIGSGIAALVAVFAYISQRRLGTRLLWQVIAPLAVCLSIASMYGPQPADAPQVTVGMLALSLALAAPGFWALVAYAYLSPHLWHGGAVA